jgi:hypothetical protein
LQCILRPRGKPTPQVRPQQKRAPVHRLAIDNLHVYAKRTNLRRKLLGIERAVYRISRRRMSRFEIQPGPGWQAPACTPERNASCGRAS